VDRFVHPRPQCAFDGAVPWTVDFSHGEMQRNGHLTAPV
jgi:hypothetical protein